MESRKGAGVAGGEEGGEEDSGGVGEVIQWREGRMAEQVLVGGYGGGAGEGVGGTREGALRRRKAEETWLCGYDAG